MKKRMKVIVDSRISAIDQSTWMQRINRYPDLRHLELSMTSWMLPSSTASTKPGRQPVQAVWVIWPPVTTVVPSEYLRKYPDYNGALALAGMEEDEGVNPDGAQSARCQRQGRVPQGDLLTRLASWRGSRCPPALLKSELPRLRRNWGRHWLR